MGCGDFKNGTNSTGSAGASVGGLGHARSAGFVGLVRGSEGHCGGVGAWLAFSRSGNPLASIGNWCAPPLVANSAAVIKSQEVVGEYVTGVGFRYFPFSEPDAYRRRKTEEKTWPT